MKRGYYAIQQAERTADIYIFGDIVPFEWLEGDVSAKGIVNQIEGLDVDVINVHIDSYGGAVSEGWAIYNALRKHSAQVNTYGDGFVASAALYPFLAGDNRYASNLSAYYFHQVSVAAQGYAEDLRAAANEADLMTDIGITAFVERAGMEKETVQKLMKEESWLSPGQALEYGVATAITADESPRYVQGAKRAVMQADMGGERVRALEAGEITLNEARMQMGQPPIEEPKKPGSSIMQMLAGLEF